MNLLINNNELNMTQKEFNLMQKNFIDSLCLNNNPTPIAEILSIIESPFLNREDNDLLSTVFHKFYTTTDIPIALPVFSLLSIISAICVKNKTKHLVPLTQKPKELATWVMCLAPSGSSKTLSNDVITDLIPKENGEPIVKSNFTKPNGPGAFVQELEGLPEGRGFWFMDEASQMFKAMETPGHPMAEIRQALLQIKDHKKITWKNMKNTIETEKIVITQLFINTIDSMARHLSEESMKDGVMRRYLIVDCQDHNDQRKFTDFPLYDLSGFDEKLEKKFEEVLTQDIYDKTFTFSHECKVLYEKMFDVFWHKQYSKFMDSEKTTYRTYMMESWKFAVFHHLIHKKEGYVIDALSLQWGLKVVMFLLNSLQSFISYKATMGRSQNNLQNQKDKLEKMIEWIKKNESIKGFGLRSFQRRFTLNKEEALRTLTSLKNTKRIKSTIFKGV